MSLLIRNDSIWRRGADLLLVPQERYLYETRRLFKDRELNSFFERPHVKQSFDAYMTEVKKDWKRDLSLDLFFLND